MRRHCLTICEPVTVGNTKVIADPTNNFVINVDIELWSRIPCWRRPITSDWSVFECVDAKRSDIIVKKHLIGQTVIVPYMENTDSDILGLRLTSSLTY